MTFESEGLLNVAILYIWLPPASYVVFSDNSGNIIFLNKEPNGHLAQNGTRFQYH